ncbi:AraC family transcriptional regulator [Dictyobacter aurantiacus]|uniref:AraC family transcriptional regulator n=1 Tax=Dictyobacter aurantiacus TaxID=1936993 RepID=A0A401ZKB6_9CHLR|nr:AraC family transcriptional regulator [Dictyobacter aurantiacus]GCE07272.1 AraC family transcriptional regulator [Dictyobacter aurantiacus]
MDTQPSRIGSYTTIYDRLTAPLLYLSSEEAGWQGLVARAFHEPTQLEGWMAQDIPDISLVLFSGGTMHIEQRPINGPWKSQYIHQGELILQPATDIAHEIRWQGLVGAPTRTFHLQLSPRLLANTAAEVAAGDPAQLSLLAHSGFKDPLLTQICLTLWQELEQGSPTGNIYAQTASQLLAVHLLRHYTAKPPTIKEPTQGLTERQIGRVRDYVLAHLDQELSLEALARQVGFSPYHFARLFRQTTGESPHQFVLRQQVEQAQHLCEKSEMPLAQVALACGFSNQSHLTRVFKRYLGLTPRAFRQQYTTRARL